MVAPGLALDLLSGHATLAGELIGTRSEGVDNLGWLARLDVPPAGLPVGFGLGYADAPETIASQTRTTRAVFGHVTVRLDPRRELRLDLAHGDREDSYVRTSIALALTLRF